MAKTPLGSRLPIPPRQPPRSSRLEGTRLTSNTSQPASLNETSKRRAPGCFRIAVFATYGRYLHPSSVCVSASSQRLDASSTSNRSSGEIEERAANEQRGLRSNALETRAAGQRFGAAFAVPNRSSARCYRRLSGFPFLVWWMARLAAWEDLRPRLAVQGDARVRSRSVLEVCGCLAFIRYGMASTFLLVVLLLSLETWDLSLIVVVSAFPASDIISKSFIKLCWYIQTITLSSHDGHVQRNAGECQSHVGHT